MPRVDAQIPTSDGVSDGSLHVPDGAGPWPGVVVFPDAFGLRDTTDEKERGRLFGLIGSLTNDRIVADADAYADFLLARPEVRGTAIGTTGYCMGGRMSLVAAGGIGDNGFTEEHAELLGSALAAAGVPHTIEFYPGHHGFAVPDNAPYDEALAQRHWDALRGFYAERLS